MHLQSVLRLLFIATQHLDGVILSILQGNVLAFISNLYELKVCLLDQPLWAVFCLIVGF